MSQGIELQFKKKDEKKGYAVGTIETEGLVIPVIINNFELAPLDVCYKDGKTLPLTEETLGSLVNSNSAFKDVINMNSEDKSLDFLFERSLIDLQPTSILGKHASIIDRVSDSITTQQKEELLQKLSTDKKTQIGFETNNTVEILEKIATVKPKDKIYFKESLSKVLPRDVQYIYKESRFKYKGVFLNSQVDNPVVVDITPEQAKDLDSIIAIGKDIEKKAEFVSKRGVVFNILNNHEKLIVMNVDGMRKHAYLDIKVSTNENCNRMFTGDMPQVNDYGIWVNGNESSKPFEIINMIKSAQCYEITGTDGIITKKYIPVRSVDKITKHAEEKNTYYVPTKYKFVKIGEFVEIDKQITKQDKLSLENYYVRDDINLYNLCGPEFAKYAALGNKINSLNLDEAKIVALQCGSSKNMVQKMASTPSNIRIPFKCVLKSPKSLEKVAELLQNEYKGYSKKINGLAQDLIKEASALVDTMAVDAILSLNLVTKENILEFARQLPVFEQVLSDLAKLILTIRLGFSAVPEMAVVSAMKGLSKVVETLRGISKLQKIK